MNLTGINFCVIKNPINERKNPIIFLTRRGVGNLDKSIVDSEDYKKACSLINKLGYKETDILTFEKIEEKGIKPSTKKEIKDMLEKNGMKYSLSLEKNIKRNFELINSINPSISNLLNNKYIKTFNYKEIPPIGSRITLFFNLFIECRFYGEKCFVNLNGDFFSNKDDDTRNFLGMVKCSFIRVEDIKKTGKIIFKSCEKNSDLMKTIPINYAGHFISKTISIDKIIEKTFVYYMMEVKDSLLPDNRITIEINNLQNFNDMLSLSYENKKEYKQIMNSEWNIEGLQDGLIKIYDILLQKMQKNAEIDEFEKAAKVRDDAEYIKNKIQTFGKINKKQLKYFNFLKNFHIK